MHREGSYAGSRSSLQGPPSNEIHHSGNYQDPHSRSYQDPHPSDVPRYNGGVHYPDDPYDQGPQEGNYGYDTRQLEPQYLDGGPYDDDPRFGDPQRGHPDDPGLDDYNREVGQGRGGDPYNDSFQQQQPPPPQNNSFHDPRHDSYQGPHDSFQGPPVGAYDPNMGIPPEQSQQYDPYGDQDRYSDAPRDRRSYDQAGSGYPTDNYQDHVQPQQLIHNDSFRDNPLEDPHRRLEGLPALRSDPFADDPFREQSIHGDMDHLRGPEDPYYRGPSPSGGPDPGPYDDRGPQYDDRGPQYDDRGPPFDDRGPPYEDRGPPYDDRGPPYDDRGPPYDDRGPPYNDGGRPPFEDERAPPYDERDGPDPYSQSAPRYNQDQDYPQDESFYPVRDVEHRLEHLNLGAAPGSMPAAPPSDDRRNMSMDGRGNRPFYPDLQEVIDFLGSSDDSVKASAAAHLQHITYMDDDVKAKTRALGGIRPLIRYLSHDLVEVHKNSCGALQNLSYGKNNNDNKREIKNEGGIPELIRLLRKTDQEDVKESVTGVLWNLSSCEDLKQSIIEDGLTVLVNSVILMYSSYGTITQLPWTAVCRNTTGILRNVSSAGFDARKRLRECRGLVNALIYILKVAAEDESTNDIDNKVVENVVCILRNLSYRIQEVVDPDFYKKRSMPRQQSQGGKAKSNKSGSDGAGCFGNKSNKAKNAKAGAQMNNPPPELPPSSIEYRSLWGPEIHSLYSTVLKRCTNPITMEAAAGAIQNLTACDWQPAVESRSMVRKEKGLPLLVDLLSAESDRVVCATATALRNLAIDEKNKELVGKYAIRQLVNRLPRDNRNNLPDDSICAVVATLYEVIKDNQDFALALVVEEGLPRLMHINNSEGRYLSRTLKFTQTLLWTLWGYKSLHAEFAKRRHVQADFTTSKAYPRSNSSVPANISHTPSSSNHTTPYNTLSRPISGQGYDDNTLTPARTQQRGYHGGDDRVTPSGPHEAYRGMNRSNASLHDNRDQLNYSRDRIPLEEVPMNDMGPGYAPLDEPQPHRTKPPVGGVPLFPNLAPADPAPPQYTDLQGGGLEPLYAQVNKGSRRRMDPYNDSVVINSGGGPTSMHHSMDSGGGGGGADSWV